MKSARILVALLFLAITTPGFSQMGSSGVEGTGQLSSHLTRNEFLEQLMRDTAAEIEWSRIAETRGTDPEVKAFAKKVDYQNRVLGYEVNQTGQAFRAHFDPAVSGKLAETSEKLRTLPAEQVDIAYLKNLQELGHKTVDMLSERYSDSIEPEIKALAMRDSNVLVKENSEAHDLLKKHKK